MHFEKGELNHLLSVVTSIEIQIESNKKQKNEKRKEMKMVEMARGYLLSFCSMFDEFRQSNEN